MFIDPTSVFLWLAALMTHGRRVDNEVGLGDLVWSYLRQDGSRTALLGEA